MGVLEDFAAWLVYGVLGMAKGGQLAGSLHFFIADTVKVFILLAAAVFLVSIIRTFITREKIRKWLGGRKEGTGNLLAALLGIPTPFCSCSAVPIFIGFIEAGVPLGITFSFLIASPMINEIALALLFGLFGWEIALLYVASGLAIAVFCGIIIGRLGLEKEIEGAVLQKQARKREKKLDWQGRILFAKEESIRITSKVAPYILAGIAIGSLIHGFVPVGAMADLAGKENPLAVPIAVIMGIPLYSNAAGMIPIVQALMEKGVSIGTALAFMMSVTALSFPEMVILRRVLKPKLLAIFIAVLGVSITITGFIFNAML